MSTYTVSAYTIGDRGTTLIGNGQTISINPDNQPNYAKIVEALINGDDELVGKLIENKEQNLIDEISGSSEEVAEDIHVKHGMIYYKDRELPTALKDRILWMIKEGHPLDAMAQFIEKLYENPSYRVVSNLFQFLEKSQLPLTEEGNFLAYKKVRNNYTDIHSGKFDNSIGKEVSVPRNMVDENAEKTCSHGLHVCAQGYLDNFGSGSSGAEDRVLICEVNPRDVVAIPNDYNHTKMRVSRYFIVDEVDRKPSYSQESFGSSVVKKDLFAKFLGWLDKQRGDV